MNDIRLTPQLSAFILNVKKYISQKKLSIDEFFYEIKLSNPKRITSQEFARIVQRINQSGIPVNVSALFAELSKGSAVIPRQTFISSFFKVFKIDRIHLQGQSMCLKPKGSRVLQKTVVPPNPIEVQAKRKALFGLTRLKHHMQSKKQILDKIFMDCDINKSGTIDKIELNKLLFASGIKQFTDKDVRRHLVHYVFDELLKKELMEKSQFFSLLEYKKEIVKEKSMTIKREVKTNNIRRSVKAIKVSDVSNQINTPQKRMVKAQYVITIQTNGPIRIIQPGYNINPQDEDVNDYINDYLDNLPGYNIPQIKPYNPKIIIPKPYDQEDDYYDPRIKPKNPKIKPINPYYDDPIYDPYNDLINDPYDPYDPQNPYDDIQDPQYIEDNPQIKPYIIKPVNPIINPYDQDIIYENPKIKPKNPKNNVEHPKFQISKNKQNNIKTYPNAGKYYRLGIPSTQDKPYIQELQRLLSNNKNYQDPKNPKTNGNYVPAGQIFNNQPFQLIDMSSEEMNSQRKDLKIGNFIQANDINQGQVGDCYFLCAIGSVAADYPELLSQLFLFEVNPSGYYAVKIFVDGEWKIFKTDDYFALKPGVGTVYYAKPNNNEIWVMLLEKCFAKVYGSFQAINGGQEMEAFFALTGAPSIFIQFKDEKTEKNLKEKIFKAQKSGHLMATAGMEYLDNLSEQERKSIGLVRGHAYSLIYIKEIQGGVTLVKIRNPWGHTEWKGDWSFESNLWTPQLRNELNFNTKQNGTFFMNWKDYYKYFGCITICKVNSLYVHTSLRMMNNKKQSNYVRMNVSREGLYNIYICQQASRRYMDQNYPFSSARIIILREGPNGKHEYVGAAWQFNTVCNAQVNLTPGKYLISAKVEWLIWQSHECFLVSYGPEKVTFQKIDRSIAPQFKQGIFPGFALANRNNAKIANFAQAGYSGIQTETYMSTDTAIGYVKTTNKTKNSYTVRVDYQLSGMKMPLLNSNTYVVNLRPSQEDVLGFFINPLSNGYSYSYNVTPK